MEKRLLIRCTISVFISLLIGFLTTAATQSAGMEWHTNLTKPFFQPPMWIVVPIWFVLYFIIGIAAGIIWNKGFYHKWVKIALYHFGFILILDGFYSIIFFGFHAKFLALLNIIILFIVILLSIKYFKVISNTAAYLLIPYAAWIFYTTALTFEVWRLNM